VSKYKGIMKTIATITLVEGKSHRCTDYLAMGRGILKLTKNYN
jgi:hypothetical protein